MLVRDDCYLMKCESTETAGDGSANYSRRECHGLRPGGAGFCQRRSMRLAAQLGVKVFASLVEPERAFARRLTSCGKTTPTFSSGFFYYLEDTSSDEMGLIVFDELERTFCRRLLNQMEYYFLNTYKGRQRSSRIVPEPFFVHSDLTTAVQIADIVAYSLNWGLRLNRMDQPTRPEIEPFGQRACRPPVHGQRPDAVQRGSGMRPVYGITYIDDLRPRGERHGGLGNKKGSDGSPCGVPMQSLHVAMDLALRGQDCSIWQNDRKAKDSDAST